MPTQPDADLSDAAEPLAGESIAVVGAGFGGLSAACYLADAGADVTAFERNEHPGGYAGRIERDGFRIDTGPSWYLMPEVFDRFFEFFGRSTDDYYDLIELDPLYEVIWKDGDRASMPADRAGQKALFESYEPGAGDVLDDYLADAAEAYDLGMDRFVYPSRSRLRDMVDADVLRSGRALPKLREMDDYVGDYFDHEKLRQIAEYKLVFLGGSPYNTPAIYTLMSHVDMNLGVYHPVGGIASVVDAMADLARELGVSIRTSEPVTAIEPSIAASVPKFTVETEGRAERGDAAATPSSARFDRVVANAAPPHVERDLLPAGTVDRESYWESRTYAPSAYLAYLGVEGEVDLDHHTLVFPTDWRPHFDAIFDEPEWPEDPAYYVHVPSKTDPEAAPDGHEAVFLLVPLAAGLDDDSETRERFRERVFDDLAEHAGVDFRDRIVFEETACVSDFRKRFNAPRGTALALSHTLGQTGPLRPAHRAPGVDGLYYVGAYTNPGIGMPMCLLSGEHVAEAVVEDATGGGVLPSVVPTSTLW
ncbi:NAD(P)/FAD-dependent oxidoreductase [Halorubrum sp. SP9]|uniref:phytoene desaturase family protein n=1 Tax=Halorubrum sp. SP9 TaxID=1537267 RepID=UPI0010F94295|nr:phytoene desaturase family protein [Halorubrum sp. SP9]TKX68754.1 phytoene desaturase [Halorubrum sp. SP9]